ARGLYLPPALGQAERRTMNAARNQILETIRKARGRSADNGAARAAVDARLSRHARGTVPARVARGPAGLRDLFVEQAEALSASVARVAGPEAVPEAVADYLASRNLPA